MYNENTKTERSDDLMDNYLSMLEEAPIFSNNSPNLDFTGAHKELTTFNINKANLYHRNAHTNISNNACFIENKTLIDVIMPRRENTAV